MKEDIELHRVARMKLLRDMRQLHSGKMERLPADHKLRQMYSDRIAEIDAELDAKR